MGDPEKALLDAANSASDKVAVLHIAFLAVCAYVLIIAFSTTDLDLLIGKGIKLPVVDVEVPILGFYLVSPYLIVLVHFNLLLQLQLLARKLYAFESAAQQQRAVDTLLPQLHNFPFTQYLIGNSRGFTAGAIAVAVTMSLLLFPILSLLVLEARFLAYQSELMTWAQRGAIIFDAAVVIGFWPIIVNREDSWRAYFASIRRANSGRKAGWLIYYLVWIAFTAVVLLLPGDWSSLPFDAASAGPAVCFVIVLFVVLTLLIFATVWRASAGINGTAPVAVGISGLIVVLPLMVLAPFLLMTPGEVIDLSESLSARLLHQQRHLDLQEKVLTSSTLKPEQVADLRSNDIDRRNNALQAVQAVDLKDRGLRNAIMAGAVLPKADLRGTVLEGVNFEGAQIEGVRIFNPSFFAGNEIDRTMHWRGITIKNTTGNFNFEKYDLSGSDFRRSTMYGINFSGANLSKSLFQGANVSDTNLVSANLSRANLTGTYISPGSRMENTNISSTILDGATLFSSDLRNSIFTDAKGDGISLLGSKIGRIDEMSNWELVDLTLTRYDYTPAAMARDVSLLIESLSKPSKISPLKGIFNSDIRHVYEIYLPILLSDNPKSRPKSCLVHKLSQIDCAIILDNYSYRERLYLLFEKIICREPDAIEQLLRRTYFLPFSAEKRPTGLATWILERQKVSGAAPCPGIAAVTATLEKMSEQEKQADRRAAASP